MNRKVLQLLLRMLPDLRSATYTVDEIQDILGISRTSAYNLVNSNAFRIVRIGGHIRIPCKAFDAWLDGEEASN